MMIIGAALRAGRRALLAAVAGSVALGAVSWDMTKYALSISKVAGTWTCGFDRNAYAPNSIAFQTFYVDRNTGSSGNSGLSWAAAKGAPNQAMTAGMATGFPFIIMLRADQTFERARNLNLGGTVMPNVDFIIMVEAAGSGRATITTHDNPTWATSKDATYTNCTLTTLNNVGLVVDRVTGVPIPRVADAAAVNAIPSDLSTDKGAYTVVSSNQVYVRRKDGAVATTTNTRTFIKGAGSPFAIGAAFSGHKCYVENVDFEGGTSIGAVALTAAATNVTCIFRNCTAKYSGDETNMTGGAGAFDGFAAAGTGLYVFIDCLTEYTTKDGFNVHSANTAARQTFYLTINCIARKVGMMLTANSCNGLTGHENSVMIDVNGQYEDARGVNVRHIDNVLFFAFGTRGYRDLGDGAVTPAAFRMDNNAVMYGVDCVANMNSPITEYAAIATASAKIYMRGFVTGGAITSMVSAMPAGVLADLLAMGAPTVAVLGAPAAMFLAVGSGSRTRAMAAFFEGDAGTYSLVGAPGGVSIAANGLVTATTGAQTGISTFTVRKTGANGHVANQPVRFLVGPPLGYSVPNIAMASLSDAQITAYSAALRADGAVYQRVEVNWNEIEPVSSAAQDWTIFDKKILAARAAGLTPVVILKFTAPWASAGGTANEPPTDTSQFGLFAGRVADHCVGSLLVRHWEIWNEPNASSFFNAPAGFKWSFPDMCVYAYGVLKNKSSANTVMIAGFTNVPTPGDASHIPAVTAMNDIISIANDYHNGFSTAFPDFQLSTHPYCPEGPAKDRPWDGFGVNTLVMGAVDAARGNTTALVWFTEFGAPTGGNPADPWFPPVSELRQVEHMSEAIQRCVKADYLGRVQALMVHRYDDMPGGSSSSIETYFGVVEAVGGRRKPAADFLRRYGTLNEAA